MLDIVINPVYSKIDGPISTEVLIKIDEALKYHSEGYQHTWAYQHKKWDGYTHLFHVGRQDFRTGLLKRVTRLLDKINVEYRAVSCWENHEKLKYLSNIGFGNLIPFEFQVEAVKATLKDPFGIIASPTGCHARGQSILMYDGSIKNVEHIKVGDLLMGPDSSPRCVKSLVHNVGEMVKIVPRRGMSFIVNKDHILTLKSTNGHHSYYKPYVNVSVRDYLKWAKYRKHCFKLFRVPVEFDKKFYQVLPLEPYFLGLLLGDGSLQQSIGITTKSHEIIGEEVKRQAKLFGLRVRVYKDKRRDVATYFISGNGKHGNNIVKNIIKDLGLINKTFGTKFIPDRYKTSSLNDRLDLLAGLIDSDGSLSTGVYDFISKSRQLSNDLAFVARSVGFSAKVSECFKSAETGFIGKYYRVCISGDIHNIPCRLPYKKAKIRRQKKSPLVTGFSIEPAGINEYFGFSLDGDGRFLLGDFTVTHNTGKTLIMALLIKQYAMKTLIIENSRVLLDQTFEFFDSIIPGRIGVIGDGNFFLNDVVVATYQSLATILGLGKKRKPTDKAPQLQEWLNSIGLLISDEVHEADTDSVTGMCTHTKANKYIGLTATPYAWAFASEKGKNLAVEQNMGTKVYDSRETTDFIELGLTVPLYITRPIMPTAIEFKDYKAGDRSIGEYKDVIDIQVINNEERNYELVKHVSDMVKSKNSCYVYYDRIAHGKRMCELLSDLDPEMLQGSTSREKRNKVFKDIESKKKLLVVSDIGSYGLNIKSLNSVVLAHPQRDFRQIKGRTCRSFPGKECGIVIDLVDVVPYLWKHSEMRKAQAESDDDVIIG